MVSLLQKNGAVHSSFPIEFYSLGLSSAESEHAVRFKIDNKITELPFFLNGTRLFP